MPPKPASLPGKPWWAGGFPLLSLSHLQLPAFPSLHEDQTWFRDKPGYDHTQAPHFPAVVGSERMLCAWEGWTPRSSSLDQARKVRPAAQKLQSIRNGCVCGCRLKWSSRAPGRVLQAAVRRRGLPFFRAALFPVGFNGSGISWWSPFHLLSERFLPPFAWLPSLNKLGPGANSGGIPKADERRR